MTLAFSIVECARCEARRQTRFPCPECGKAAAPTEIDIHVQTRQRAVQAAAAARSASVNPPAWSASELLAGGRLDEQPKRVFDTADRLARGDANASTDLAVLAGEIAILDRWADEIQPLRPLTVLTRPTQLVVRSLVRMYDVIAATLVEERLDRAQQSAVQMQQALDVAAEGAAKANALLERANRVLESTDPMGAWIAEAFANDPIAATVQGHALLEAHAGRAGGSASALAAIFYESAVGTIGDPDEFWRLVRAHLAVLDRAPSQIIAVASDPLFASRAVDVTHDLWSAARRAAVAPDAPTLRAAANELLEAGHLLVEQPLKFHLGVASAATTRMTFAVTQAADVSQLVKIADDKGWEVRSAIGETALRNAFAHRDFGVVGDEVSLAPQRRSSRGDPEFTLPLDQVQDGVLRLVETLAAMDLALALSMDGLGVSIDAAPLGRVLAPSLLPVPGWSDINVADDGATVVVSATAHDAVSLRAVAVVAQPFVGSAERLMIRLARADLGSNREVKVDLDAYAEWATADEELEKEAMFIKLGRATLLDGHPMVSDEHAEKALAVRGCQILVDRAVSDRDVARQIKVLRDTARELGLESVRRALGKSLRLRVQAGAGIMLDPNEFDDLLAIAERSVPALPESIV